MMPPPTSILITGLHGFVAPHLVAACAQAYPTAALFGLVHAPTLPPGAALASHTQSVATHVTEIAGDITDDTQVRRALHAAQPDLIFHLAALSSVSASWQAPLDALYVNAGGFVHLAEGIRAEGLAPRVVVVGSGEQYGAVEQGDAPITEEAPLRPVNPYAVAKATQDLFAFQYFKAYHLDVVRARPFNHFGPGQGADFVVASFARQIAQIEAGAVSPILTVGNLAAQRDFLPVSDVAQAYVALARHGRAGEAYNVGSGVARSIASILDMLVKMANVEVQVQVDMALFRPTETPRLWADTAKIRRDTGWSPTIPLEEALRVTLLYWREQIHA